MKSKLFTFLAILLLTSVGASAQLIKKVQGDGKYVTKEYSVDHFTEVVLKNSFNVVYTQDPAKANTVRVEAESNIIDMIEVKVKRGRLTLSLKKALNVENGIIIVYIASEKLYQVKNASNGVFELNGTLKTDKLDVSVTSDGQIKMENIQGGVINAEIVSTAGDIHLGGKATKANYSIKVGGEIRADKLKATNVNCVVFGSGSVGCHAEKQIKTHFWGSGKVYYRGTPEIVSGGIGKGEVIPIKD